MLRHGPGFPRRPGRFGSTSRPAPESPDFAACGESGPPARPVSPGRLMPFGFFGGLRSAWGLWCLGHSRPWGQGIPRLLTRASPVGVDHGFSRPVVAGWRRLAECGAHREKQGASYDVPHCGFLHPVCCLELGFVPNRTLAATMPDRASTTTLGVAKDAASWW